MNNEYWTRLEHILSELNEMALTPNDIDDRDVAEDGARLRKAGIRLVDFGAGFHTLADIAVEAHERAPNPND